MIIMWLYARLLKLYPRPFYNHFGAEILDVFAQAWRNHPRGHISTLTFCLHEFSGLLVSIATEHIRAERNIRLRTLFARRFVPVWLLVFSVLMGAGISQRYWGYVIVPPSSIGGVQSVEHIALVRFDSDYRASVIPLHERPNQIISDFPPSQILSAIPLVVDIEQALDPALLVDLAEALAREKIDIGAAIDYPREPVNNAEGCGANCFVTGVQPQTDGTLLVIWPEMSLDRQPPLARVTQRVTPNERWYYDFIIPAGYMVQGRDAEGRPVVFTAIATRLGGDRYQYHELTFLRLVDGLTPISHMSYNFDVAGIEGFNLPWITLCLWVPLFVLWLVTQLCGLMINAVRKRVRLQNAAA